MTIQGKMKMKLKIPVTQLENSRGILISRQKIGYQNLKIKYSHSKKINVLNKFMKVMYIDYSPS